MCEGMAMTRGQNAISGGQEAILEIVASRMSPTWVVAAASCVGMPRSRLAESGVCQSRPGERGWRRPGYLADENGAPLEEAFIVLFTTLKSKQVITAQPTPEGGNYRPVVKRGKIAERLPVGQ